MTYRLTYIILDILDIRDLHSMTHGLNEQLLVSLVSPAHVMLLTTFDLSLNSDPVPQVTLHPDHSDHTVGPVEKKPQNIWTC